MTISLCWRRKFLGVDEIVFASDSRLSAGYRWDCAQKIFPIDGPNFCISFAGDADFAFPCIFQFQVMVRNYPRFASGAAPISDLVKDFLAIINQMSNLVDDRKIAEFTKTEFLVSGYDFNTGGVYQKKIKYSKKSSKYEKYSFGGVRGEGFGFAIGFIGDNYSEYFKVLGNIINDQKSELNFQPLEALKTIIDGQDKFSPIGGVPQVVKVYRHRNYLPYAVRNSSNDAPVCLFGRPLLEYEKTFYPIISLDKFRDDAFIYYPGASKQRPTAAPPQLE